MGTTLRTLLRDEDSSAGGLSLTEDFDSADVIVDYSYPGNTAEVVSRLRELPRPLLVGTTGLTEAIMEQLTLLAREVPVLVAANTGTGIQVLRQLVRQASASLGAGWDIEVLEMHHNKKIDAPSGTAWALVDEAARGTGSAPGNEQDQAVTSREGEVGPRPKDSIGVQSLRGGDVVGEHTVFLVGPGERLELTHRCWDRSTFARGGLRAARWLAEQGRESGLYSMADVLSNQGS